MKKRVIKNQQYENYWKLTMEVTNIYGNQFNFVLAKIVEYIDKYSDNLGGLSSDYYQRLQDEIGLMFHKADSASTRKSINQMFKLGFINNKARSYHFLTKKFLIETDKEQKKLIYSRIIYDNASFSRSFSNDCNINEIKFLIKSIQENTKITKDELLAIMYCDVTEYKNGYISPSELKLKLAEVTLDLAAKRKYNQNNYLFNLCKNLTDVYVGDDFICLDPSLIMDKQEKEHKGRDTYLQRLYKIELINEEKRTYHHKYPMCVVEHKGYPVLIASHIKPYRVCNVEEQFDKNNGLLLSKNMDSLFDGGYISFDEYGNVIVSTKLNADVAEYVKSFKLDDRIYNQQRKLYMQYHRDNVFLR